MSTQRWIRLDVGFARNPKVLALLAAGQDRAAITYVFGLLYSGEQGSQGFIPTSALLAMYASTKEADALCEAGLWVSVDGGWQMRDWREYQSHLDSMQKRSESARKAAQKRWANNKGGSKS